MKTCVYIFVLFLAAAVSAENILLLRSSVKVTGAEVVLGDLVTDRSSLPEAWVKRRLFSAPPVGEVSYFALTTIAHALQDYHDMQRVMLRGEPVISVQREDRRLEQYELEEPILSYLSGASPWDGLDLQVDIISIPDNTRIPVGKTEFTVTAVDQKTSRGYSLAYVVVRVDGLKVKEIPVGIEIQSLTDVWVVRKNLSPGHLLELEDLRKEKRVVEATSGYVPSSEHMVGFEVTRGLGASTLLLRNSISKPVCVRRGEWVAINVYGGNLQITLRGKAMVNGRLGERILCVNERSQRQVLVELVGVGSGILVRM